MSCSKIRIPKELLCKSTPFFKERLIDGCCGQAVIPGGGSSTTCPECPTVPADGGGIGDPIVLNLFESDGVTPAVFLIAGSKTFIAEVDPGYTGAAANFRLILPPPDGYPFVFTNITQLAQNRWSFVIERDAEHTDEPDFYSPTSGFGSVYPITASLPAAQYNVSGVSVTAWINIQSLIIVIP